MADSTRHIGLPFSVPSVDTTVSHRRASTSTASSQDDSDPLYNRSRSRPGTRSTAAIKMRGDDAQRRDQEAGESDDDATLHSISMHSYPPLPQHTGVRGEGYKDEEEDEGEAEEARGLLRGQDVDVERQSGAAHRSALAAATEKIPAISGAQTTRRKGLMLICLVLVALLAAIPILTWLSSGSLSRVVVLIKPDEAWTLPLYAHPNSAHFKLAKFSASSNDAAGSFGLANADHFNFDYAVPGWKDAEAAARLNVVSLPAGETGKKLPSMEELFNGTFSHELGDLKWSKEDPDVGVFTHVDPATHDIIVQDVTHLRKEKTGKGEVAKGGGKVTYVKGDDVLDNHGMKLKWSDFLISPDMMFVLFITDRSHQWRYSTRFNLWLYDLTTKKTVPIGGGPHYPAKTSAASWAPKGNFLAYVQDNDLYTHEPGGQPHRITQDGTKDIFNAVPDWVYEEEVFNSESVYWWSPSGTKLAYLRLDETAVSVYSFPIYNPDKWTTGLTTPYLTSTSMKYPKPGFPNPTVSAHVVDVAAVQKGASAVDAISELLSPKVGQGGQANANDTKVDEDLQKERLITEVTWTGADEVLLRETNRVSDRARLLRFVLNSEAILGKSVTGTVVRRDNGRTKLHLGGGWITAFQEKQPLGAMDLALQSTAYLDILPTKGGFRHLAFFANSSVEQPLFITQGEWEVDQLLHADLKRQRAYFLAASPTPSQRHVYLVGLPDITSQQTLSRYRIRPPIPLTDIHKPGWHSASFDPKGAYYILTKQGPDVPSVRVLGLDDPKFELVLQDNADLRKTLTRYVAPSNVFYTIQVGDKKDVIVSVREIRPHDFDASGQTRYPVLVNVYGGPNSQTVKSEFDLAGWHTYLATSLGYVVINIDGRGTGFRGRHYRCRVTNRLGVYETDDVVDAMREIRKLPYVDESRTGIWGWSYGGYLTSKVIQADSGMFGLGMAVAPVSKWEFYDSIYTERYMKMPSQNRAGYANSSVMISDGFRHARYLLAQGSGDDNVHFESSAHLLDILTKAQIRNFQFRMFTDSAHSISVRGAYRELHEFLIRFLVSNWGPGGLRKFDSHATRNDYNRRSIEARVSMSDEERQKRDMEWVRREAARAKEKRRAAGAGDL